MKSVVSSRFRGPLAGPGAISTTGATSIDARGNPVQQHVSALARRLRSRGLAA
jgi:hypothetical protein